jgi:hypothetical protein
MSSPLTTVDDHIASRRANAQVWLKGIRELHAKASKRLRQFIQEGSRRLNDSCDADEIDAIVESARRTERILGAAIVELSPLRSASPLTRHPMESPGQVRLIAQE